MTPAQHRFLWLHESQVVKWQWVFGETMLRAFTDTGATATISRRELDELIQVGAMQRGVGFDVHLTDQTREAA